MTKLREIMSTELVTVAPQTTLRDAAALLATRHVGGAPVLRDDDVVGIVSAADILSFAAAAREEGDEATALLALVGEEARDAGAPDARPALDAHTVSEVMTRKLWALDPEADVALAAQVMMRNGLHRVIVAADGKLAGIVTTSDVARVLAEGRAG